MTATVELVYDRDCPNADGAREVLRIALNAAGLEPQWIEWDRGEATSPSYTMHYGSPTILVNGEDVSGEGGSPMLTRAESTRHRTEHSRACRRSSR